MKMEVIKHDVKQVYLEKDDSLITVTQWSNLEGCTVCMTGKDLSMRFAAELRWEEVDIVIAALAAGRSE